VIRDEDTIETPFASAVLFSVIAVAVSTVVNWSTSEKNDP
jgi:hypothetical protein